MKKQLISFLTALLLVLLAAFLTGAVSAKADDLDPVDASSGVDLYTLSQNGYLKLTGRAIPNGEGYLETDFASSGFETIINAPAATDLVLTVSSYPQGLYKGRVTIYVDESEYTFVTNQGLGVTVTVPVPAGQHTIRAIKEAIIEYSVNDFTRMDRIQFNGTILGPAPEKPLYIVYIGASSQCGAHADVLYYPGTIGGAKNHYVTKSACFKLAELLNADINVVAKGGIGLMMTGVQELIGDGAVTMQNLYPYSGYRTRALGIPYDFTKERKPDLIMIGISGNDSNSEAECEAWVNEAKNFILFLKEVHGQDVPVVWQFSVGRDILYRGLRDAYENDPQLSAYDDLYIMTLASNANGGAAIATQTHGHPDALDYAEQGQVLYDYVVSEGILFDKLKAPEPEPDYTYYVAPTGSDGNDGLTAATPLLTVSAVLGKLPASIPADAHLTIKVTGEVVQSTTREVFGGVYKTRSDGSSLPIVIETLDYDGTGKAVLKMTAAPTSAGTTSFYCYNDVTFRNVTIRGTGDNGQYALDCFYTEVAKVTFDNVDWVGALSKKLSVYANPLTFRTIYAGIVDGTQQVTSEVTFKNGVYDDSTGFATISAIGGNGYLWKQNDNQYSVPGLTCRIVIAEGAVLSDAKMLTSFVLTSFNTAEVEVRTKGVLNTLTSAAGRYAGTTHGTSAAPKTVNGSLSFKITGGHVIGGFVQLGNFTTVNGNVSFTMNGGEMYVPEGTAEQYNSIFLCGAFNTANVNGNVTNNIKGGSFYIKQAANIASSIMFAGRTNTNITGTLYNRIESTAFQIVKERGTAINANCGIYLAMDTGTVQTGMKTEFVSGLVHLRQVNADLNFGSRGNSAIRKMTNVIGVPAGIRSVGPTFNARMVLLGGRYNQLGVSARSTTVPSAPIGEVVLSNTVHGMRVSLGSVNYCTYNDTVYGSVENTINNGYITVSTVRLEAVFNPIYGHVKNVINGGIHYGIVVSTQAGSIHGGLEYIVNNYNDYGRATGEDHPITFANCKTIKGTATVPALSITMNGGAFHGPVTLYSKTANIEGDVEIDLNGAYIKEVDGVNETGFITGGHFSIEPKASYIADGLIALGGQFENTDEPRDIVKYAYEIGTLADAVTVELLSQSTRGDVSFADLQGGGIYKRGTQYTITAPDLENFTFLGWYTPGGARATKNKTYSGTANEDATRIAKYELTDSTAILTVTADAFQLTVSGETTDEAGTITKYLPAGTAVSLKYTDGTKPFIAWLNGSDKIIGTDANEYSFTLYVDLEVKATASEAGAFDVLVTFENEYSQLLSTQYVENDATSIEMPTPPQRLGRTLGWDKDAAAILAEIQGGADTVTVKAIVTARTDDTYTVNVNHVLEGAEGTEISENVVSAKVGAGVLVEALEELSGKPFMYVKLGDEIISYERTFPFKANADTELTAVYGDSAVEKAPLVTMTIALRRDNGDGATDFVSFTALRVIPEDCEVISQGFLVTQDASIGGKASAFIYGANGVKTAVAKDKTNVDITTVNMQKAAKGTAVYGRAFVVIRDGNGVQSTIYSEIVVL